MQSLKSLNGPEIPFLDITMSQFKIHDLTHPARLKIRAHILAIFPLQHHRGKASLNNYTIVIVPSQHT